VAGVLAQRISNQIDFKGKNIVCVCTGHGLKDPDIITKRQPELLQIPAQVSALEELIVSQ
jgi:threonine synthase